MDKSSKIEVYIQTIRMRTLPAVLGPILIAISIAINTNRFDLVTSILILLIGISLQILVNLFNKLFILRKEWSIPLKFPNDIRTFAYEENIIKKVKSRVI